MEDKFNEELWKLGIDNPEMREAIARTINSPNTYSIPTRKISNITGELEDITLNVMEIEDQELRERAISDLKQAQHLTVKDLAVILNVLHIAYSFKEAKGEKLTPQEKTLKDLDITALAYTLRFMNYPKEAYKTFESPEAFEEERARILEKAPAKI